MDYNTPAPPNVVDGNYLSAYWVNQLSQYVNKSADAVYSTNVFQWTYASSVDIAGLAGMYVLQHKYNSLVLQVRVETGCAVKVRLSKNDDYTGYVQVYSNNFGSTGDFTISIDLSTSGFSVAQDEIYFCYVEFDKGSPSSYLQWIKYVYEAGAGLITAPTIPSITASTTIDKAYLDTLLNGAKGLGQFTSPRSIPFAGVATSTSVNNGNTFLRWRANHIHRYLHMGFLPMGTDGGGNAVIVYLNQQSIYTCANDHVNHDLIFDLTALPNGVAEPAAGAEYEICIANDQNAGYFRMRYLWELPYL